VEEVNRMVLSGTPFRDAYKQVGLAIEKGEFNPDKSVNHTHEGSIGNLGNEFIVDNMTRLVGSFKFDAVAWAVAKLVK
jgi:argininosuccinate lyase